MFGFFQDLENFDAQHYIELFNTDDRFRGMIFVWDKQVILFIDKSKQL